MVFKAGPSSEAATRHAIKNRRTPNHAEEIYSEKDDQDGMEHFGTSYFDPKSKVGKAACSSLLQQAHQYANDYKRVLKVVPPFAAFCIRFRTVTWNNLRQLLPSVELPGLKSLKQAELDRGDAVKSCNEIP
jgi:hypothetical protein